MKLPSLSASGPCRIALTCALLLAVAAVSVGPAVLEGNSAVAASAPASVRATVEVTGGAPAEALGLWATAPAVVAILLAIVTRQVIVSLALGTLVAAWMSLPWTRPDADIWNPVPAVAQAVHGYVIKAAMTDVPHIHILLFTLFIGGMVGIIRANGGTAAMVQRVARWASSPERCQIVAWVAGLIVFFDDYANTMVVGPTMRQITDKLKVSREKLAYVVDSTAAPVASLAVGTWFGAEIGFIQQGLDTLKAREQVPGFLIESTGHVVSGFWAFFLSWPYRFYAILAIVMVFLIAWRGRDFGPMLAAERNARAGGPPNAPARSMLAHEPAVAEGKAWHAVVPVLALVAVGLALIVITGAAGAVKDPSWATAIPFSQRLVMVTHHADAYASILYGALCSLVAAGVISVVARTLNLEQLNDAMIAGMARIFPALVILVLAWALAAGMADLQLADAARDFLQARKFSPTYLPLLVFLTSAGVSFATGTSWGTMSILCPVVVVVAADLVQGEPTAVARHIFYGSVGSVLAGSVFGDHCSPISDTTVLSSLASECNHVAHVWTQMPYAIVVAVVGTLFGDLLCTEMGWSPFVGIGLCVVILALFLQIVGRRVGG